MLQIYSLIIQFLAKRTESHKGAPFTREVANEAYMTNGPTVCNRVDNSLYMFFGYIFALKYKQISINHVF